MGGIPSRHTTYFFVRAEYTVPTGWTGGGRMGKHLGAVILVSFAVDLLLLMAASRMVGLPKRPGMCLVAAAIGGVYGGLCILPGMGFWGGTTWRMGMLALMSITAFGLRQSAFRAGALFVVLTMAWGAIAAGFVDGDPIFGVIGTLAMSVMCIVAFSDEGGQKDYTEVELWVGQRHVKLLALRDTGNRLTDPVTGKSVLVADADAAMTLLQLTKEQLRHPVETVASGAIPGLRLIPYRAVGQSCGMLVAVRLPRVRVGDWQGSGIVAFAPEGLGEEGTYRALTGGYA